MEKPDPIVLPLTLSARRSRDDIMSGGCGDRGTATTRICFVTIKAVMIYIRDFYVQLAYCSVKLTATSLGYIWATDPLRKAIQCPAACLLCRQRPSGRKGCSRFCDTSAQATPSCKLYSVGSSRRFASKLRLSSSYSYTTISKNREAAVGRLIQTQAKATRTGPKSEQ